MVSAKQTRKKFNQLKVILPMKFMFLGCTMVTLRSETLLCINTSYWHTQNPQSNSFSRGEGGKRWENPVLETRKSPTRDNVKGEKQSGIKEMKNKKRYKSMRSTWTRNEDDVIHLNTEGNKYRGSTSDATSSSCPSVRRSVGPVLFSNDEYCHFWR